MKLIRHGEPGRENPGLQLADGRRIDASPCGEDYDETIFATGGLGRLEAWAAEHAAGAAAIPPDTRLGSPVARPSKIVCIGLNFKVPFLLSYLSQFMTLLPGDVISAGTPAGVGAGMKPPQSLKPGDQIELGIEGLGSSCQTAVAAP